MSIAESLRQAVQRSDETLYRIAKDTEIDWGTLQRFLDGTRPNIRLDTVEKLSAYFGLELRPIARHRTKSVRVTSGRKTARRVRKDAGGP